MNNTEKIIADLKKQIKETTDFNKRLHLIQMMNNLQLTGKVLK